MNTLIFYSRLPTEDMVGKIRIGQAIKNQSIANELARALILDMLAEYLPKSAQEYSFVFYYKGNRLDWDLDVTQDIHYVEQPRDRELSMDYIHQYVFEHYKSEKAIIVGSDIALMNHDYITQAFSALETNDIVIGPVEDGGYGLIGMKQFHDIYSGITNWESRSDDYSVFKQTQTLATQQNLTMYALDIRYDIDEVSDVQKLYATIHDNHNLKPEFGYLKNTFRILHQYKNNFGI